MQVLFQYLQNRNNNCYWYFENNTSLDQLFVCENLTSDHWKSCQKVDTVPLIYSEKGWEWYWQDCFDETDTEQKDENDGIKSEPKNLFLNNEDNVSQGVIDWIMV